jgi:hypothetical protein
VFHRSRGLFSFGAWRAGGGAILRTFGPCGPCGWAFTDPEPMIEIAIVAIAATMFVYRRPTSCFRLWPTIRPDRRPRRNLADQSLQSHPACFLSDYASRVDALPGWQRLRPRPNPSPEPVSLEQAKCSAVRGGADAPEFCERGCVRKKEKPRLVLPARGGPIIVGRLRVSFSSRIEQTSLLKVARAVRPTTSYTSGASKNPSS